MRWLSFTILGFVLFGCGGDSGNGESVRSASTGALAGSATIQPAVTPTASALLPEATASGFTISLTEATAGTGATLGFRVTPDEAHRTEMYGLFEPILPTNLELAGVELLQPDSGSYRPIWNGEPSPSDPRLRGR
jgi:hypothetical protein